MICSDDQVRAGASAPLLPRGWVVTGGPIQASAAAYEQERATTHWFLLPLSSSKNRLTISEESGSVSHCTRPRQSLHNADLLLGPATSQKSMEDPFMWLTLGHPLSAISLPWPSSPSLSCQMLYA